MKVAFLARFLNLVDGGGSSYSLNAIATELTNRGHDVHVYVTHNLKSKSILPYNNTEIDFNTEAPSVSRFKVLSQFRSETLDQYDVVHVFNPAFLPPIGYSLRGGLTETIYVGRLNTYTLLCSNFSKMDGECHKNCGVLKKTSHSKHNGKEKIKRTPRYVTQTYLEPKLVSNIDLLFSISPHVKKIYKEYGYENKIHVVPNFIENFEKNSMGQSSLEPQRLLYVGRIEPNKGVGLLLSALKYVGVPFHLDIVGDGSQRQQLEDKYSCGDNYTVDFHGYVPHEEIGSFYRNADLFVHPGLWPEPFGRTILEALQHDCPVLTSDIGAPPWIVGDAGETFLRGDVRSLSKKITYLLENRKKLCELKSNCEKRTRDFSKEGIVDEIENLYLSEIERKSTR